MPLRESAVGDRTFRYATPHRAYYYYHYYYFIITLLLLYYYLIITWFRGLPKFGGAPVPRRHSQKCTSKAHELYWCYQWHFCSEYQYYYFRFVSMFKIGAISISTYTLL